MLVRFERETEKEGRKQQEKKTRDRTGWVAGITELSGTTAAIRPTIRCDCFCGARSWVMKRGEEREKGVWSDLLNQRKETEYVCCRMPYSPSLFVCHEFSEQDVARSRFAGIHACSAGHNCGHRRHHWSPSPVRCRWYCIPQQRCRHITCRNSWNSRGRHSQICPPCSPPSQLATARLFSIGFLV